MKPTLKTLHMRFSSINPPHEILCRPGLVGPKIAFSIEATGVSWSESSHFLSDQLAPSRLDQLTPTIPHCNFFLITEVPINLETANNRGWIP